MDDKTLELDHKRLINPVPSTIVEEVRELKAEPKLEEMLEAKQAPLVISLGTAEEKRVTEEAGNYLRERPLITDLLSIDDILICVHTSAYTLNSLGTELRKVSDLKVICFTPDGRGFLVSHDEEDGSFLFNIDFKGHGTTIYKHSERIFSPQYSPDGKHILFFSPQDGYKHSASITMGKLFVINTDGTGLKKLTDYVAYELGYNEGHGTPPFFWYNDSKTIVFLYSKKRAISTIQSDGTGLGISQFEIKSEMLLYDKWDTIFTPNKEFSIYDGPNNSKMVWKTKEIGREPEKIEIMLGEIDIVTSVSPDGRFRIMDDEKIHDPHFDDTVTSIKKYFLTSTIYQEILGNFAWSPNSKKVAFCVRVDDGGLSMREPFYYPMILDLYNQQTTVMPDTALCLRKFELETLEPESIYRNYMKVIQWQPPRT